MSQQKFRRSQDASKAQRKACWKRAHGPVCVGRGCIRTERKGSCRRYCWINKSSVRLLYRAPMLKARTLGPACSGIHTHNSYMKKGQPPCSSSSSCTPPVKDRHPLQNFVSLAFTGEQEMRGGQLFPFRYAINYSSPGTKGLNQGKTEFH